MAGPAPGLTGSVAWAGSGVSAQLASLGARARNFSLEIDGEEFDGTAFDVDNTTAASAWKKGIFGPVTGSFDVYMANTDHGFLGSVTNAASTVLNLDAWRIRIARTVMGPYAAFGGTAYEAKPGIVSWDGDYEGHLDDATACVLPVNASEPATGTFVYYTGYNLSGSIFTTRLSANAEYSRLGRYAYRFRGAAVIAHNDVGAQTNEFIPAGNLAGNDPATVLTLTYFTGRSFAVSAFWTSIDLECRGGSLVTGRVGFHGSGTVTPA